VRVNKAPFVVQPDEIESAAWFTVEQAQEELSKGMTGKDLLHDWLRTQES